MINDRDWADGRIDGSRVKPKQILLTPEQAEEAKELLPKQEPFRCGWGDNDKSDMV